MGGFYRRAEGMQVGIRPAFHGGKHRCVLAEGSAVASDSAAAGSVHNKAYGIQCREYRLYSQFYIP